MCFIRALSVFFVGELGPVICVSSSYSEGYVYLLADTMTVELVLRLRYSIQRVQQ